MSSMDLHSKDSSLLVVEHMLSSRQEISMKKVGFVCDQARIASTVEIFLKNIS